MEFNKGAINAGECISGGWNLIKNEYGLFLGISLVGLIMISCIPCVTFSFTVRFCAAFSFVC